MNKLDNFFKTVAHSHSEIIKAKYRSKRLIDLKNEEEVVIALLEITKYVCGITGWKMPLPNSEKDFYSTFGYKLKNNYKELSIAEVKLAFMQHCSSIKNYYDKPISIPIIDEIMGLYLIDRDTAIELEQQYIDKLPQQNIIDIEKIKNNSRELIQEDYEKFLNGTHDPINSLYSHSLYDILVTDSIIDEQLYNEYLATGLFQLKKKYSKTLENENLLPTSTESERNIRDRKIRDAKQNINFLTQIENEAKKYSLKKVFLQAKKEGVKNIYNKVD
jgi:hypothetical protein